MNQNCDADADADAGKAIVMPMMIGDDIEQTVV